MPSVLDFDITVEYTLMTVLDLYLRSRFFSLVLQPHPINHSSALAIAVQARASPTVVILLGLPCTYKLSAVGHLPHCSSPKQSSMKPSRLHVRTRNCSAAWL